MTHQNQSVYERARRKVLETYRWVRVSLGIRERMGDDGWHKIKKRIGGRDLFQGPLCEGRIARALRERTELEELIRGDLARGGLSLALTGLLGFGRSALGKCFRGDICFGSYRDVSRGTGGEERTYQLGPPREEGPPQRFLRARLGLWERTGLPFLCPHPLGPLYEDAWLRLCNSVSCPPPRQIPRQISPYSQVKWRGSEGETLCQL